MLSPKRCQEIRATIRRTHGWRSDETSEERREIDAYWQTMPGSASFSDAVAAMSRGAHIGVPRVRLAYDEQAKTFTCVTVDPSATHPIAGRVYDDQDKLGADLDAYAEHVFQGMRAA